ncbi:GUN4 domain-containing protein [Leptodesmis sichuanensis]|uniref:GUN4 domain-containing protein n=1 Tax=Leptodesmis sichuanensis TaxID=2906798 RepID=UPI001F3ED454|nr:GUN4 domain-containing protein [Leptodesmis sichuanensis]UIE39969.1 GUN4 domain-containing protein [Leptodesmis sichuanensis A121]
MTNWAVIVGINHYDHLAPQEHLQFAVSDAERVKRFLCEQAGFREDFVILCSDTSPSVGGFNTRPSRSNLRRILREISHHPQARGADQAWFFFSGHGLQSSRHQNYMLTCDGVPDDLEDTALSVDFVIQQLIHCQAKNTVLVLDMCRNEASSGSKGSNGLNEAQIVQQAQQNGIVTIFSCSRGGKSYELPDLQQGAFTHAFLEGLQQYTILRQLSKYLTEKVYALTKDRQPAQIPLIVSEPDWKGDLPLLPQCITNADITQLQEQANDALYDKNYAVALQCWEQVATAASNLEIRSRAIKAIKHILELQRTKQIEKERVNPSISPTHLSTNFLLPTPPNPTTKTASIPPLLSITTSNPSLEEEGRHQAAPPEVQPLSQNQPLTKNASGEQIDQNNQQQTPEKSYDERLAHYQQQYLEATRRHYPVSDSDRRNLQHLQQVLQLNPNDILVVEKRIETARRPPNMPTSQARQATTTQDNLRSERGVDYRKLRDLLQAGKWKESDQETLEVLLKVAKREKERSLSDRDIQNLPCTDLKTINQLWNKYSNGKFGFSIQQQIWQNCGAPLQDGINWENFGDLVGWRTRRWLKNEKVWISTSELSFRIESAPRGHLPRTFGLLFQTGMAGMRVFFCRFRVCKP